jgi:MerR family transcriptional regulator, light-induced transcriptional regulator
VAVYSIKDLEKLTGIKAHTIRIWEERYGLIVPNRTQSNIRFFTDLELKKLFNVALLNKNGLKISKIAKMSSDEIAEKASDFSEQNHESEAQIDALTLAMLNLDEGKFNAIFHQNIKEFGFERAMLELIYPFLDKLNLLWLTGSVSPAHENFIQNLIRQKMIAAIDALPANFNKNALTYLLFLPENETQELSLLFMYFLAKLRGNRVIYLGLGNSLGDIKDICSIAKPNFAFTIINDPLPRMPLQQWLNLIQNQIPNTQFLITGQLFFSQPVQIPNNFTLLKSLGEAMQLLDNQTVAKIYN